MLKSLSVEESKYILNEMAPDDRTALLAELPPDQAERLIDLLDPEQKVIARALLDYGEDSVGRLMTPDYVVVRKEWTIRHVLDHIRAHGRDSETLNVIYIVDDQNRLIDDLRIREILLAPLHTHVSDVMDNQFVALAVTDDKKKAVEVFRKYDRTALPVVDTHGRLAGIVTLDDVHRRRRRRGDPRDPEVRRPGSPRRSLHEHVVARDGAETRDLAGHPVRRARCSRRRPWASSRNRSNGAVVLALFVPLIISSGGNSGSQAATLIIRALALGEVRLSDWWRVMRREIVAGLLLGTILASIGFVRIAAWNSVSNMYGPHWFLVGSTVSLSLIGVVLWGTLTGSMLPFLLRWMGFDPATSSAPFVATLVDVTGLIIYFTVAMVLLRGDIALLCQLGPSRNSKSRVPRRFNS